MIYFLGVVKMLCVCSFYLEMLIEYFIDELFVWVGFSCVNFNYFGGGYVYLLLFNMEFVWKFVE